MATRSILIAVLGGACVSPRRSKLPQKRPANGRARVAWTRPAVSDLVRTWCRRATVSLVGTNGRNTSDTHRHIDQNEKHDPTYGAHTWHSYMLVCNNCVRNARHADRIHYIKLMNAVFHSLHCAKKKTFTLRNRDNDSEVRNLCVCNVDVGYFENFIYKKNRSYAQRCSGIRTKGNETHTHTQRWPV